MKFKRKLKKFFLYDRSFIKMVCLLIVLLLVLILGNSFGYVSADESSGIDLFLNMGDYESSDVYSASNQFVNYITTDSNSILASNGIFNHDFSGDFTGSASDPNFNFDDITYYFITGSNYPSVYRMYMFTGNDAHCYINSYNDYVILLGSSTRFYVCDIVPWGDGTNLQSPYLLWPETVAGYDTAVDSALWQQRYTQIELGSGVALLATNLDVLTIDGTPSTSANYRDVYNYLYNGNLDGGGNNVVNVNYLYDNAHGIGGFDNLSGIGDGLPEGGNSDESSENNLYLQDSKWNFSIPAWKKLTSYSGNATFSASLNDFQQENLNDFYLRFTFAIYTTQSYVDISYGGGGTSGGGHDIDVLGSGSQYTGYKNYIFKYLDSSSNNQYLDVTLQDFYNMGSSKAFMTLNGIFDRCYKVGFSGNMSDTKFLDWYNEAIVSSANTTTKATLYCYATLYDSSGNTSGNCTFYYDLLNGTSGVTDSSMSVNNNPYVDEDGDISTTIPEEGTTESTYNGNGVNVTQNVTVNNDSGDSKSWLWTLISSLISSDDETVSQAGMSDTLVNFVGINPWISLMSTTFGFIPATIWTTLSACFLVVMGILVVAFVLRIILDLL